MRRWPALVPILIVSVLLIGSLAVFLTARRAMGAFSAPLPPWPLVTTALFTLAWAWCVRAMWSRLVAGEPIFSSKLDRLVAVWVPFVVLLFFAVACSFPGNRVIDWAVWLPVLAADWYLRARVSPARRSSPAMEIAHRQDASDINDRVLQQITRFRAADGRDVIQGTVVAELAPGEQTAALHVAFCPPFERLPHVEAEAADGPDAAIKIVQVLHNGVRLDVQLSRPADCPSAVSVDFFAAE